MADFGKLNFQVSFNPTTAFPLDARSYFTSLALAKAAAATAEEVGSKNTVYYFGMPILVSENNKETWYIIKRNAEGVGYLSNETGSGSGGGTTFETDSTLVLENGILRVNTTNKVEADNTLPITSAGVHTQVGNIEVLLNTI
jgi:hypothetical protein